ncbi:hypothetical protein ABZ682_23005 [Streptomyces griseoviridis]|uniref:hypothetical protein n=1 Tax=Streptomyces griseoviridis TaxID=45398 RepID=UPI0033E5C671
MRPFRLPDAHLPSAANGWTCRACFTPWPCAEAAEHLSPSPCSCGQTTYWEKRGPRNWHPGKRCYTPEQGVAARVADAAKGLAPRYPPSHFYPPKPARVRRQSPPIPKHWPTGPGDIRPGTWTWIKPGGLHPGWGDIHHLAMVTAVGDWCDVWLVLDGTVHQVRADRMLLDPPRTERPRWWNWTVADHLAHRADRGPAQACASVQLGLFEAPAPV